MGSTEAECIELVVDVVEVPAFLDELERDPLSADQACVWFSASNVNCAAISSLIEKGVAQVSLQSQTQLAVGGGHDVGVTNRRWLPVTVLVSPSLPPHGRTTAAGGESNPHMGDECCCSAAVSPCLAEALHLLSLTTTRDETMNRSSDSSTSDSTGTKVMARAPDRLRPVVAQDRLLVRELPSSLVALASVVELSGPYPAMSPSTARLSSNNDGRASDPVQLSTQLASTVSSVLPSTLDGQVLTEGSIFRVAGLFGLVVARVRPEGETRLLSGRPAKNGEEMQEEKEGGDGQPRSKASSGGGIVRVHGATELRLLSSTRSTGPWGTGGHFHASPLPPETPGLTSDGSSGIRGIGHGDATAAAAAAATVGDPPCQLQPRNNGITTETHRPTVVSATSASAATPLYRSSLGEKEWIRLVERDFAGLGDQVATTVSFVGTTLRGNGADHDGGGGELISPASGFLLHGPTGVGKTLLARSVAEHSGAPSFFLDCASVFRRERGKAELYVQEFLANAGACSPSVVILDQVESVGRRRPEAAGITELQVLSVLLEIMDRFRRSPSRSRVCFLATCPDAAALDPSLLQRGRLEAVLRLGALDSATRAAILDIHARGMVLELAATPPPPESPTVVADRSAAVAGTAAAADPHPPAGTTTSSPPYVPPRTREEFLTLVAARCHGYLGSDLERLCREAAMSHMSTPVGIDIASDAMTGTASTAAANTNAAASGASPAAKIRGPEAHEPREGGAERVRPIETTKYGGARGGGGDRVGGGDGRAGVALRDFWAALNVVRPASLIEHSVGMWGGDTRGKTGPTSASALPLVGCEAAMAELRAYIVTPLANPSLLRDLGLRGATGALLHGPPGCGKTTVARALAAEVKGMANFLEVRCSDLVDKVVGRSERNVSDLFATARAAAPCVLFLDQVEGVAARRGYQSSTEQTFDRILSTLLVEMDGVMSESGGLVVVLAATNDIERLDPAILRPGRLDRRVHLGIPDAAARAAIFLQRLKSMPLQMEKNGGRGVEEGEGQREREGGLGDGEWSAVEGIGDPSVDDVAPATTTTNDSPTKKSNSSAADSPPAREKASPGTRCLGELQAAFSDVGGRSSGSGYNESTETGALPRPRVQAQWRSQLPLPPPPPPPPWPRSRRKGLLDSTEAYAKWLASETEGKSCAHLTGVCREAALAALREGIGATEVAPRHFEAVLGGGRGSSAVVFL